VKIRFIVAILSFLIISASSGSTQVQTAGQDSTSCADSSYGDFSEKEDCILNYARSCNERNIDRFAELFHPDCEFIYMMGKPDFDADIFSGQILEKSDLQSELESIGHFFVGVGELRFEIETGTWMRLDSLSGEPCTDCWTTSRGYSLSATFGAPGEGGESRVMNGHGHMEFVISPVDGKWKILRYIDEPIKEGDQ
jgi:hypothetical protein